MFHSIKDAYSSASKNNMADVKELIPEFFYLPEMFKNVNNFDLGTKQNGILIVYAYTGNIVFIQNRR